ncbi:CHAT domain-containing protein [Niveibacterium terrae]|uniref:CHAT domain-containing protein n=1 Tax=Niveibacterium terrae TaxID=3373598 RepID=UPI003A938C1D
MTRSYQIRGSEQLASPPPRTTEITISTQQRILPGAGREAGVGEITATSDQVVRLELENGFVLWTRIDDLIREKGREALGRDGGQAWEIVSEPAMAGARGERGWLGLGIKALEFFGVDLQGKAAGALGHVLEEKLLGNAPGLYRCSLDDSLKLTAVKEAALPASADPVLVFLHGTASSFAGSFGKLWETPHGAAARSALKARYGERVYALEHRSLTVSPIQNALDLVNSLPKGTELHLVSHSRGGLIGELLCLAERNKTDAPLNAGQIEDLFAADRTIAKDLGLCPLQQDAAKERDAAYDADRARLLELLELLEQRQLKVRRFVRVACPALGTTLASGRLDRWLSVLNHLTGNSLVNDAADFMLAVVKERTDPRTLPGLEAMMPGSALTHMMQLPGLVSTADLSVIAGDIEGDSLWGQIKLLAADWFFGSDHDLVVNTRSMYGGIRRPEARFQFAQGPGVCHFNYFSNKESVGWLVAGLTRADGSDGGFKPILQAKKEEPHYIEAMRRSRSVSIPRPLAVLLPGTMGSALNAGDDTVWLRYFALLKGGLARLRMGKPDIRPTDILGNFYGPLIEFLTRSHRVEVFPYDWRLSVREAAVKLADSLENWLPEFERSGQPVHLVAHSMGGLVVRAMIADGGRGAALWRRIIALPNSRFMMLGTPNLGSHEAVRWLTGHNPTLAKISLLDLAHDTDQIIDIVNRFPGLLELLPFDPNGPDFSRLTLWNELKGKLAAHWSTADADALGHAQSTWDLLRQAAPDPKHMVYVAGSQRATVVDYRIEEYEEPWLAGQNRLAFIASGEGDGTVSWKSGRLPDVPTWYVEDTAHDELCTNKQAFPGILDLLMTGTTTRLANTAPAGARAEAPVRFLLPALPPCDGLPDEESLSDFGFGISRPVSKTSSGRDMPLIEITLTHGDLAYARYPVIVGHYLGDSIISAESSLDARLGKALSRRSRLGLYPERLGSHALFFQEKAGATPAGAVVIGLGQVGELSPALLSKSIRDAMLNYAQRVAQWPDERFGPANQVRSAALSCLLVGAGSSAGGVSVRDSIEAILEAAVAANKKLEDAELDGKVIIDRIEFVELYEDIAIAAAEALDKVLKDSQLALRLVWPSGTIAAGQGSLSRVRGDDAPGWWQRLEIIEDEATETLRFIATTDRARAEETLATGQLRLADGFIRQASQSASANTEVTKTLYEMLLPNRLKELAQKDEPRVLLVDAVSARYPWELIEDRWSEGSLPPAIAAGLVRQLKTPNFRPHPAHATEPNAFVVGNPDLSGWDLFGDLPGARHEAQKVSSLLSAKGFATLECIDGKADAILAGLHNKAWRILHLAGHGEHEFELKAEDSDKPVSNKVVSKRVSGMVIGKNTFLTPGDVEQMRWVPELVFLNCCHLGKTLSKTAREGQLNTLAANLAVQFINMGVKAVVAAGWAVDDAAGEAFAASFYCHLLDGESFGEAVLAARKEIWMRFPNVNTWGAYQCYGDPGYRLRGDGNDAKRLPSKTYHAPVEFVSDIRNYTEWIRRRVREENGSREELEGLRAGLVEKLGGIPSRERAQWLCRADVAAVLGFAWGETREWAEAVNWLETALSAKTADCPVRALEQCAIFHVQLAAQHWSELRASASASATEAGRAVVISEIEHAIDELDPINLHAPSPERLNQLGEACKYLAWVQASAPKRQEALANMAGYYGKSCELSGWSDPCAFSNWAIARVLSWRSEMSPDEAWRRTLADDCQRMIAEAKNRDVQRPNFADRMTEPNCELVLLLAQDAPDADASTTAVTHIAELYRAAMQRDAGPREHCSVLEHLDFVREMVGTLDGVAEKDKPLINALATLRAAL